MPLSCSSLAATNIRYQITGGNIGNAFAVQNTTGVIYVASPLDYETRPKVSQHFSPSICLRACLHVFKLLTGATQSRSLNFSVFVSCFRCKFFYYVFFMLIFKLQCVCVFCASLNF